MALDVERTTLSRRCRAAAAAPTTTNTATTAGACRAGPSSSSSSSSGRVQGRARGHLRAMHAATIRLIGSCHSRCISSGREGGLTECAAAVAAGAQQELHGTHTRGQYLWGCCLLVQGGHEAAQRPCCLHAGLVARRPHSLVCPSDAKAVHVAVAVGAKPVVAAVAACSNSGHVDSLAGRQLDRRAVLLLRLPGALATQKHISLGGQGAALWGRHPS